MSSSSFRTFAFLVASALLVGPRSAAFAQEVDTLPVPVGEVSAGYMFLHDSTGVDFPAGWYFSGAVNPTRWLGIVAEAAGSYKNDSDVTLFGVIYPRSNARVFTLLAGPRVFGKQGRLVPHAQVLAGIAHMRSKKMPPAEYAHYGPVNESSTQFALQPGAGVTVYLTRHVGVRVSGDYRRLIDFSDELSSRNEYRVLGGFTFQWGER